MSRRGYREPDKRDRAIVAERVSNLNTRTGPRVGDWVDFSDGTRRRISYIWPDPIGAQTSAGGSFYLGDGHVSFSGSLYSPVPLDTLTEDAEIRMGSVWIFHHDDHTAHNGVDLEIPFRVYKCSRTAPN